VSATCKVEDTLPAAIDCADTILRRMQRDGALPDRVTLSEALTLALRTGYSERLLASGDPDHEALTEALDELTGALTDLAPDYCYFGPHPDDPACWGLWVDVDAALDNEWRHVAGDNYPAAGRYISVNDFGNVTLVDVMDDGSSVEVWGVV
jgi:hypothetical protein